MANTSNLMVLGVGAAAVYYFWPQIEAALGIGSGAATTTAPPATPTTTLPAVPVIQQCPSGMTLDAAGVCTLYTDAELIAGLNELPWTGTNNIPSEQLNRIDPQILATYSGVEGVTPGSVLAFILGLGGVAADGTTTKGSDGNTYVYNASNSQWTRQTPQSGLSGISRALPMSNGVLMQASVDPFIAALVARDPRAILSIRQWDLFYSSATGMQQVTPAANPQARVNALQYHAARSNPAGNTLGYVRRLGTVQQGGGSHRSSRSPFPRPATWRQA